MPRLWLVREERDSWMSTDRHPPETQGVTEERTSQSVGIPGEAALPQAGAQQHNRRRFPSVRTRKGECSLQPFQRLPEAAHPRFGLQHFLLH